MIVSLQAVRAVAALLVLLAHWCSIADPNGSRLDFTIGVFGVDIFFVLSGFVMALLIEDNRTTPGNFIFRRICRIYPTYWVALLCFTPFLAVFRGSYPGDVLYEIKSALLLPSFNEDGKLYPQLAVGWTLIDEMFFYALVSVALALRIRRMTLALTLAFATTYIISFFLPKSPWQEFLSDPIYFEFVLGLALHDQWKKHRITPKFLSITGAIGLCILLAIPPTSHWRPLLGLPAFAIVAGALAWNDAGRKTAQWLAFLGNASYAIYLSHVFAIGRAIDAIANRSPAPELANNIIAIPAAVIFGCLFYLIVDNPLQLSFKFISRRSREKIAP